MSTLRSRPAGPPAATVSTSGGIGRPTSRYAEEVSDALRRQHSPELTRRRLAVGLTLLATASLAVVEAYQVGLLRHVPEPPWPGLDADRVDAAGEAYALLGTPDAGLGIASYGISLVLFGAGTESRAEDKPWLPLLAAGKALLDATSAGYLFTEQVTKHRRVCSWCTVGALANVATVPLALPEARRAWRALRRR
ncbi:MAG: vitamin K epoxide reductase family protein [Actinomycetota bacterium]|nr:vitamin K epoxide reductase family protein [Actinomycetota bacterium]